MSGSYIVMLPMPQNGTALQISNSVEAIEAAQDKVCMKIRKSSVPL